jgi:hypothetical protein
LKEVRASPVHSTSQSPSLLQQPYIEVHSVVSDPSFSLCHHRVNRINKTNMIDIIISFVLVIIAGLIFQRLKHDQTHLQNYCVNHWTRHALLFVFFLFLVYTIFFWLDYPTFQTWKLRSLGWITKRTDFADSNTAWLLKWAQWPSNLVIRALIWLNNLLLMCSRWLLNWCNWPFQVFQKWWQATFMSKLENSKDTILNDLSWQEALTEH